MRLGILADIHANLPALRAVLAELERRGVDRYVVAGDVVGYGPHPNECIDVVAGLDAVCVAGNHDLIAIGRLSDDRCVALARASLRWTAGVLRPDARDFLAGLPLRASVDGLVEVAHGSLDDPQEYTESVARALPQLARLEAERGRPTVLLLGHTHRPLACALRRGRLRVVDGRSLLLPPNESCLLNPGGVGQSRELRTRARCLLVDLDARAALFLAVPYDVASCRRDLRRAGLPASSLRLRPSGLRAARRIARRAWRAAASVIHLRDSG